MDKTLFSKDYEVFLSCLRTAREKQGLTQKVIAERLGETQSFISKCERGERRLDIVELRAFCRAIGSNLVEFVTEFDRRVERGRSKGYGWPTH
jgi:transcriptional regulator with XRE-family HTH domain